MALRVTPTTSTSEAAMHHGALLVKSGVQEIANNTPEVLTWETAVHDTDGFKNGTAGFIVPAGVEHVRVGAQVGWEIGVDAWMRLTLLKNGAEVDPGLTDAMGIFAADEQAVHGGWSPVISVAEDDELSLEVEQLSVGALDVLAARTWFAIEVIKTPFGR